MPLTKIVDGVETPMAPEEEAAILAEWEAAANRPPPVPSAISMRQARLALLSNGLLNSVSGVIEGMSEPEKSEAQIEWEYASEVRRDSKLVKSLSVALGLSDDAVDDLFRAAEKL